MRIFWFSWEKVVQNKGIYFVKNNLSNTNFSQYLKVEMNVRFLSRTFLENKYLWQRSTQSIMRIESNDTMRCLEYVTTDNVTMKGKSKWIKIVE